MRRWVRHGDNAMVKLLMLYLILAHQQPNPPMGEVFLSLGVVLTIMIDICICRYVDRPNTAWAYFMWFIAANLMDLVPRATPTQGEISPTEEGF